MEQDKLVTFGIVGNTPETGYGYIKRGAEVEHGFVVDSFVENPNLETAQGYIAVVTITGITVFYISKQVVTLKS